MVTTLATINTLRKGKHMTERAWKQYINKQLRDNGNYDIEYYAATVEALAAILARRDAIREEWQNGGGSFLTEQTNKAGATNQVINPLVKELDSIDRVALNYFRELGLTPKGQAALKNNTLNTSGAAASLSAIIGNIVNE
jgi:hypothetical protein